MQNARNKKKSFIRKIPTLFHSYNAVVDVQPTVNFKNVKSKFSRWTLINQTESLRARVIKYHFPAVIWQQEEHMAGKNEFSSGNPYYCYLQNH